MLEERRLAVLRAIVEDYVSTHEPVGSKALVERHSLGVSPATIRNDMAALEEEGFIAQPHTSAGRVPTDRGYRLFVDRLSSVKPLSPAERRAIHHFLDEAVDLDDVMVRTVRLLAQITKQVALVQYPSLQRSRVRHVEFVPMPPRRLLVVLIALPVPLRPDVGGGTRWLVLLAVPSFTVLHPAVLGRVLDAGLRAVRREPLGTRTTRRATLVAGGWALLEWACAGAMVLALAVPLGLTSSWRSLALTIGGYALAWLAGLVVVVAPAGAGAREGALVAVLATVMPTTAGLVVALLARLVVTSADLVLAGAAALAVRRTVPASPTPADPEP